MYYIFQDYFLSLLSFYATPQFSSQQQFKQKMDIRDFDGIYKLKFILPIASILGVIFCFFGPWIAPYYYGVYCYYVGGYAFIKSIVNCGSIFMTFGFHYLLLAKTSKNQFQEQKTFLAPEHPLMYGFVVPNYKEEIQVLEKTLDTLANHPRAKETYCVFLGMENHQQGSDVKAAHLVQKYNSQFRMIHANFHTIKQFQQKGKASNVSSAVQNAGPILENFNIDPENLFFTIIDADTIVPALYMDLVEENILKKYDDRYKKIFLPPQIYNYNEYQSPIFVRVMDNYNSMAHMGQLYNIFGIQMPLSNYTLSYNLVKRMGYWDTCADAIGEDYHTTQKAFWKTGGDIHTQVINVPTNQMNINTGKGYWADVKARFWQCERHCEGCCTFYYSMKQFKNSKNKLAGLKLMAYMLDLYTTGILVPWVSASMLIQTWIYPQFVTVPEKPYSVQLFMAGGLIMSLLPSLFFYYYKASVAKHIHKQSMSSKWSMILELKFLFIIISIMYIIPGFFVGAFAVLKSDRTYTVADKKSAKFKQNQQKTITI